MGSGRSEMGASALRARGAGLADGWARLERCVARSGADHAFGSGPLRAKRPSTSGGGRASWAAGCVSRGHGSVLGRTREGENGPRVGKRSRPGWVVFEIGLCCHLGFGLAGLGLVFLVSFPFLILTLFPISISNSNSSQMNSNLNLNSL